MATLADNGELTRPRIDADPVSEGAYRWHPVEMSEEHALASLMTGDMTLRTAAGDLLTLEYERHEEHASGDWTWMGLVKEAADGFDSAVITFGAKAVFAHIPQPGNVPPLKMAMRNGAVWMGETSYAELAKWQAPRSGTDFLIPDVAALDAGDADMAAAAAMVRDAVAMASPSRPTIDLILGYSGGFRAKHGGVSQAVTRINYLMGLTNRSLDSSRTNGRIHLLHTVEVAYPDSKSNHDALYELAGKNGYSVPPSLAALHGPLRAQYGADLVGMIRPYVQASSGNCGLAWVIGAGQAPITPAAAEYGFSVTSDGYDNGWGCDDLVLPHELGHNMGLKHDRENAVDDDGNLAYGAYSYAFGYKTTEPDGVGFGDIMSYTDSGQPTVLGYSSPTLYYLGEPFGTAQDDASRALRQTIPAVAAFRATTTPGDRSARHDVNGDGNSDIIVRNASSLKVGHWRMNGHAVLSAPASQSYGSQLSLVATGDFNGDGRTDILWRRANHTFRLWTASGNGWKPSSINRSPILASSVVVGAADIDGDGRDEVLIVNKASKSLTYWKVSGTSQTGHPHYAVNPANQLVATGDLNGDGRHDLVWMNSTRRLNLWWSNGPGFGEARSLLSSVPVPAGWTLAGIADINGDAQGDLVFFNHSNSRFMWWEVRGGQVHTRHAPRQLAAGTQLVALGDYNGDGYSDALMRTSGNELKVWYSDGTRIPSASVSVTRQAARNTVVVKGGVGG
ncbi:FG-GAP-like repeat-containing protein [Luteimonas sp. A501]